MQNDWLRKAVAMRDEAWHAIKACDEFTAFKAFDDTVIALGGQSAMPTTVNGHASSEVARVLIERARKAQSDKRSSNADVAERLLSEAGKPTPLNQLMSDMKKQGVEFGGADPLANFRSTMSRDDRFVSLRRDKSYFWWFAGKPTPPEWNEPGADLLAGTPGSSVSSNQETANADNNT